MTKTILSVVGLVAAGGIFFAFTQPRYDAVRALESEMAQYDQALQRSSELQQLKQTLLSRYNAFNPVDVDRLYKLLPDHVDNVRLVLDLDNLAARHGLALQNVVTSSPGTERPSSAAVANVASRQRYDSLTLQFRTQGTYTNFTSFMRDLEASLRLVDIVDLSLVQLPGVVAGEPIYRYELTIRTYWLK